MARDGGRRHPAPGFRGPPRLEGGARSRLSRRGRSGDRLARPAGPSARPRASASALLVAGVLATNLWAFFQRGLWLNLFAPLLALVALYADRHAVQILHRRAPGAPIARGVQALSEPRSGRAGGARPDAAPARRRAEGADRAVRRPAQLDRAWGQAAAGGIRPAAQRGDGNHHGRAVRPRRHARQVHRRRSRGGVRRAPAAAGPCAPRLPRGARHGRRARAGAGEMGTPRPAAASTSASASTPAG